MTLDGIGLAAIVGVLVYVYMAFFGGKNTKDEKIESDAEALHKVTEAQQKEQDAIKDQQDLDRKQLEDRRVKAIKELEDKRSELESSAQKPLEEFTEEELNEVLTGLGISTDDDAWS